MGEEAKKSEEKKVEEKKTEEDKKTEKEAKAEKPSDEKKVEVIILRVYMHCEGCARKVRRCLKDFPGVEDVETDCKSQKVVVKGENADPLKIVARLQRKSNRKVELLSPIPKPPTPEEPKPAEVKEVAKPEEKKEEAQVITVVLKVHMHCEACAQEIKKRIMRMNGVENAESDLKNSQVTVKGVFEQEKLVEYVYKRTGKQALIVKQEPEKKDDKDANKGGKAAASENEKKESIGGGEDAAKPEAAAAVPQQEDTQVLDMKKNESYYYHPHQNHQIYPQIFAAETQSSSYPPAPQMFSDENPNACSVM